MSNAKLTRLSNKNLILSAIKALEEDTGFHFTDLEFESCYFIAEGEANSICYFHIKEIPRFKFAFWNTNRFDKVEDLIKEGEDTWSDRYKVSHKSELIFFTQYERDIDKFKPSYSGFRQGIYRVAWYEKSKETNRRIKIEDWELSDLPDVLKFMHKHPIKSYVYSGCQIEGIWDEISGITALKQYIKSTYYHYFYKLKNWIKISKEISASKRMVKKLKTMDYIIEKKDSYYPEILIKVTTRNNIKPNDLEKDVNIIDRFSEKYRSISVEEWFVYHEPNVKFTKEELKQDKDLHKRFYGYMNTVSNILSGNSKETLEDWYIEKVIKMNINKEE